MNNSIYNHRYNTRSKSKILAQVESPKNDFGTNDIPQNEFQNYNNEIKEVIEKKETEENINESFENESKNEIFNSDLDLTSDLSSIGSIDSDFSDFSDLEEDLRVESFLNTTVINKKSNDTIQIFETLPTNIKFTDVVDVSNVIINNQNKSLSLQDEVVLLRIYIKHRYIKDRIEFCSSKENELGDVILHVYFEKFINYVKEKNILRNKDLIDEIFIKIIQVRLLKTHHEINEEMIKLINNYLYAPRYKPLIEEIESVNLDD